jgi:hypothetical protein
MPRQFKKGLDLYKAQKERFDRIQKDMLAMHKELADAGLGDMQELTSGTVSSATLARLGHPFGRGEDSSKSTPKGRFRGASKAKFSKFGFKGQVPLLPINVQSGRLKAALRSRKVSRPGAIQAFENGAPGVPYEKYILSPTGTRRMVARGFWTEVTRRWKARNKAFIDHIKERQRS